MWFYTGFRGVSWFLSNFEVRRNMDRDLENQDEGQGLLLTNQKDAKDDETKSELNLKIDSLLGSPPTQEEQSYISAKKRFFNHFSCQA